MKKVITYGTYDLLHEGHIRLLKRAKALGDYLIVGVTSDDFDISRGKINVQQSLVERIEAVKETGLADQIVVEEYVGQKIDDIKRYNVDIFTVGSDWEGQFDYLNEYCEVVYLPRTEGVSSTELRSERNHIRLGIISEGKNTVVKKYIFESFKVNGIELSGIVTDDEALLKYIKLNGLIVSDDYNSLLRNCDAVYICSEPRKHYEMILQALENNKHVICESPICIKADECEKLQLLAKEKNLVLIDAMKTAYSLAFNRLLLLVKSGKIGKVLTIDSTCTSLSSEVDVEIRKWNSISTWGPLSLLPVFQVLGTEYDSLTICSLNSENDSQFDLFSHISIVYKNAVATAKVGLGVKSEGELIISGTQGYIYVPAPWWKTEYFEVRYENASDNKRYYYPLDGEGIRYELVAFIRMIEKGDVGDYYVNTNVSKSICTVMEKFYNGEIKNFDL